MRRQDTVVVYAGSLGNYFIEEVRAHLAAGLRRAGRRVVEADETRGWRPGADLHLVVAPHEFFYAGRGQALRRGTWPRTVVLYNTEPLSSIWHPLAERLYGRAAAVWDIEAAGARSAAAAGRRAAHVPLGWAPSRLLAPVRRLPRAVERAWLEGPDPGPRLPWARRPLDLLFVGTRTERRELFLADAARALARHRSCILVRDGSHPARPGATTDLDTPVLLGLAQRAKVVLNLHAFPSHFFEWHRATLHGMAQGALVVSEPCAESEPFVAGEHFIAAPLADIPAVLDRLLRTPAGRRRAARVAAAGAARWRRFALADRLTRALRGLDAPPPGRPAAPPETEAPVPARLAASGGRGGRTPAVTVAVSLKDYEREVRECLDSAHAQTLAALDLIVVEDGSRDGSLAAARSWLKRRGRRFARWQLWTREENAGLAAARNEAFRAARTAAVLVLDADNILLPRCAERLWAALERTGAEASYCLLERFGEDPGIMNKRAWEPARLLRCNTTDALALVRRAAWDGLGGYRKLEVHGWEDWDFWLRLAKTGGWAAQVPEMLARYRCHLGSMLHTVTYPDSGPLRERFRREHGVVFDGDGRTDAVVALRRHRPLPGTPASATPPAPERVRSRALELWNAAFDGRR